MSILRSNNADIRSMSIRGLHAKSSHILEEWVEGGPSQILFYFLEKNLNPDASKNYIWKSMMYTPKVDREYNTENLNKIKKDIKDNIYNYAQCQHLDPHDDFILSHDEDPLNDYIL